MQALTLNRGETTHAVTHCIDRLRDSLYTGLSIHDLNRSLLNIPSTERDKHTRSDRPHLLRRVEDQVAVIG